jgi:predicted dehydrogenase
MSKRLRCAVVGLGMGRHHARGFQSHPRAEVVALCDVSPDACREVADTLNVPATYTDYRDMLANEKPDVVSIATPNRFHAAIALDALRAGAHVLCEKPMAMNAAEGRRMVAAARRARRRLMINFSYRFTEQAWALKQQVDSGLLGDIYFGRTVWHRRRGMPGFGGWFGTKALSGGGPLIDLGVHRLDLALWLMGYPRPTWVLGNTWNPIASARAKAQGKTFDVEDLAAAMIRFENGACLEIEASWAANIRERELMETRLLGTRAGLVQRNVAEGYQFEAEVYLEREGSQFDMALHPPVPEVHSSYYHFIEAIATNTPHIATGEEGLVVMELLDAIYRSAAAGRPVRLADRSRARSA